MKLKKLWFIPVLLLSAGLVACSNQKKQATPILTKNQVIKKSQKPFKSGQVIQSLTLKTDTSSQVIADNTSFGGDNGTVFHINNQSQAKGQSRNSEEWVNLNNVFVNSGATWYKTDLEKLSGHTYADLVASILNNQIILAPNSALTNSYKMTRSGQTYTLTSTTNNQEMMQTAAKQVANTIGESTNQKAVFDRILKYGKYQNMNIKMVVKNGSLVGCNIFVNMKLGTRMTVKIGQSYGNLGNHDFLKIPANVLDAKPFPTTNTKKK